MHSAPEERPEQPQIRDGRRNNGARAPVLPAAAAAHGFLCGMGPPAAETIESCP